MEKLSHFLMAAGLGILIVMIWASVPRKTLADGCADDPVRFEKYSKLGQDAESAGKSEEAFRIYHAVRHNVEICDRKKVTKAAENLSRAGRKLGVASEARGVFFIDGGVYKTVEDARCKHAVEGGMSVEKEEAAGMLPGECAPDGARYVLKKDAGAFNWFEESQNYREADRVMVKFVKSAPEDINIFRKGFDHLTKRKEQSLQDYTPDPGNLATLERIAAVNGQKALRNEETGLKNAAPLESDALGLRVVKSLEFLTKAREWFTFFKSPSLKAVMERADKRGDSLFQDNKNPKSLEESLEYYEFAGSIDKIKKLREKAEKLGDESAGKGELSKAQRYYTLSGNKEKMDRTEENLKKELEQKTKKEMEEMMKDKEKQKKFKKEEEKLEKELGL